MKHILLLMIMTFLVLTTMRTCGEEPVYSFFGSKVDSVLIDQAVRLMNEYLAIDQENIFNSEYLVLRESNPTVELAVQENQSEQFLPVQENDRFVEQQVEQQSVEQRLTTMRHELENILSQLKSRTDFGEFGMQKVLDLIDMELNIVELLLDSNRGYIVEKAVTRRNGALKKSSPSVVRLYDVVLDLATMHTELQTKLQEYSAKYNSLWHDALVRDDRKIFLYNMLDTLDYYYKVIRNMQVTLAKI